MTTPKIREARETDAPTVRALLEHEALDAEFVASEFTIAEDAGRVIGCARLAPLAGGAYELASVAVVRDRRNAGVGALVVREALAAAKGRVYALALAPGFFAKLGFRRVAEVPRALAPKAEGICASRGFVTMVLDSPREKEVAR